ncbi:MAG TPA: chemotaxis protein CheW [Candidatus Kapabacteria bacterium]|nr:chemotaxis protein CheW [Candidatus Kapabacteria bacterium]
MTLLPFDINNNYFALDIKNIIEIIPIVRIETIIEANKNICGLINFRGELIPVVDLKKYMFNENSQLLLSSRIIIYKYTKQVIGLIIEELTDTIELDTSKLIAESNSLSGSNLIKAYYIDDENTVKVINIENIFRAVFPNE